MSATHGDEKFPIVPRDDTESLPQPAVLLPRRCPPLPQAAVLVLHCGQETSDSPTSPRQLAALRMDPVLRAVTGALPHEDVLLARVRYRLRGSRAAIPASFTATTSAIEVRPRSGAGWSAPAGPPDTAVVRGGPPVCGVDRASAAGAVCVVIAGSSRLRPRWALTSSDPARARL
ncbi:hypothetical protein [Streptomyces sp. NPDC014734]|uniref:hypothetical protein n=1 Tax=Streptomyces sp. NPDC014734 TaxID=3364886 RepID=UPI0036FA12BA